MTRKYISTTETAKLIREALKVEFPGIKFSVKSKTYSGGSSITVGWTDGPTQKDVQSVTDFYKGASFDPMIDLKESVDHTTEAGEVIHYGADYVFVSRVFSADYLRPFAAYIAKHYHWQTWDEKETVTPVYEIVEDAYQPYIRMIGPECHLNRQYSFDQYVHHIAHKYSDFAAFQKHLELEEAQREAWRAEAAQEKKWDALLEEITVESAPSEPPAMPLPFDELPVEEEAVQEAAQEAAEQIVPTTDGLPDTKDALRYWRPAKDWSDQPLVALPRDSVTTKFGDMDIEVQTGRTIYFSIKAPFKVNNVLYKVSGHGEFFNDREEWHFQIGIRRVNPDGSLVNGNTYATDKAGDIIRAELTPLLNTWLERHYELLPPAERIYHENLFRKARYKLDYIEGQIAAKRKWLDLLQEEVRKHGRFINERERDIMTNIYGGYEWRFG